MKPFGTDVNQHGERGYGASAEAGKLYLSARFGPMCLDVTDLSAIRIADAIEASLGDGKGRFVDVVDGTRVGERVHVGTDGTSVFILGSHSHGLLEVDEGPQGNMTREEATSLVVTLRGQPV